MEGVSGGLVQAGMGVVVFLEGVLFAGGLGGNIGRKTDLYYRDTDTDEQKTDGERLHGSCLVDWGSRGVHKVDTKFTAPILAPGHGSPVLWKDQAVWTEVS